MSNRRAAALFLASFALGYALVTYWRVPGYVPDWPEVASS